MSTVLTAACYWPSSHYIPAQKFVSVSGELNHDLSPLVLDSDKDVCCHRCVRLSRSGNQHQNTEVLCHSTNPRQCMRQVSGNKSST